MSRFFASPPPPSAPSFGRRRLASSRIVAGLIAGGVVAGATGGVGQAAARGPTPTEPAPDSESDPTSYAEQAPLDVDTIVHDDSKPYLHARARLVAHPEAATSAILDRLQAVPAPTTSERKRLLDVLSEIGRPEHLALFADELRRAVRAADNDADANKAADKWLPLLTAQGAAAAQALSALAADRDLPVSVRGTTLDAMIQVTPADRLGGLVVLVGHGSAPLRGQLTRSMQRRVRGDAPARDAVLLAVDAAAVAAEPRLHASLLQFRAALSSPDDAALSGQLATLADDPDTAFVVRVAAVRGLARQTTTQAHDALRRVAQRALATPDPSQSDEVLAWLSLGALAADEARPLAQAHRLQDHGAPRLASLGYTLAQLPADQSWLAPSQDNPWPQVRQAALSRVAGPCTKATVKLLAERARPKSRAGDKDPAVARSNVQALGRCGPEGFDALVDLLNATAVDIEQRTEAARQLTKHGGSAGADAVASALDADPPQRLAARLVAALRWVGEPTPKVTEALCRAASQGDTVAAQAAQTLSQLHDDPQAACS